MPSNQADAIAVLDALAADVERFGRLRVLGSKERPSEADEAYWCALMNMGGSIMARRDELTRLRGLPIGWPGVARA